jgi:hypothetical protein
MELSNVVLLLICASSSVVNHLSLIRSEMRRRQSAFTTKDAVSSSPRLAFILSLSEIGLTSRSLTDPGSSYSLITPRLLPIELEWSVPSLYWSNQRRLFSSQTKVLSPLNHASSPALWDARLTLLSVDT